MKFWLRGTGRWVSAYRIGPACWPYYDLIVVLEGTLLLRVKETALTLDANDAVLIPPGLSFEGAMRERGGEIWVQHFSAKAAELPITMQGRDRAQKLPSGVASELGRALIRRLQGLAQDGPAGRGLRAALFHLLLLEMSDRTRPSVALPGALAPVIPALLWAEQHLHQAKNLTVVANRAGLSESHFRNLFRRWRGRPAGAWLREQRMLAARRLLSSTDLPVKAIAAQVGFADAVVFNRSFRHYHGQPPGRFRRAQPHLL